MKKTIWVLLLALILLTSCGKEYDVNGIYVSESGSKDFRVVIYDKFCMINVTNTNKDGNTASLILEGRVEKDDRTVVLAIKEDTEIKGSKFEFVYNDQTEAMTNTSDNKTIKKTKPGNEKPEGLYSAVHDDKIFQLLFEGEKCELTVMPKENPELYEKPVYHGKASYDNGITTLEFEEKILEGDLYKFVYDNEPDVLMNTSDGHIFKKETEN